MTNFPYRPIERVPRKPMLGVGIMDAPYKVQLPHLGKIHYCPYYKAWASMLRRCYGKNYSHLTPMTVCEEWQTFTTFRAWAEERYRDGLVLCHTVVTEDNHIFAPDTTLFTTRSVQTLLVPRYPTDGLPVGVYLSQCGKPRAVLRVAGHLEVFGVFDTVDEAFVFYIAAKAQLIRLIAADEESEEVRLALLNKADHVANYWWHPTLPAGEHHEKPQTDPRKSSVEEAC